MTTEPASPARSTSKKGHRANSHSRSLSLRVLPSKLRPKTAPSTPDPGEDLPSTTLAPPIPQSPRVRRASAPEEGSQTPEWRSNQFITPQESDAEFVRRTYAHFSIAGVPDDGFSDGKEYTREKNGLSAWEEAALSRPGSTQQVVISSNQGHQLCRNRWYRSVSGSLSNGVNGHHIRPALNGSGSVEAPVAALLTSRGPRSDTNRQAISASQSGETSFTNGTHLVDQREETQARDRRKEARGNDRQHRPLWLLLGRLQQCPSQSGAAAIKCFRGSLPKRGTKGLLRSEQRYLRVWRRMASRKLPETILYKKLVQQLTQCTANGSRNESPNGLACSQSKIVIKVTTPCNLTSPKALTRSLGAEYTKVFRTSGVQQLGPLSSSTVHKQKKDAHPIPSHRRIRKQNPPSRSPNPTRLLSRSSKRCPVHTTYRSTSTFPRTISGHIQFHTRYGQGQRSLFHVLHAISMLCDQCGYCQGMGPIAATLLCYFSPERAYAAMVALHSHVNLHTTFSPGFPGLVETSSYKTNCCGSTCRRSQQFLTSRWWWEALMRPNGTLRCSAIRYLLKRN